MLQMQQKERGRMKELIKIADSESLEEEGGGSRRRILRKNTG